MIASTSGLLCASPRRHALMSPTHSTDVRDHEQPATDPPIGRPVTLVYWLRSGRLTPIVAMAPWIRLCQTTRHQPPISATMAPMIFASGRRRRWTNRHPHPLSATMGLTLRFSVQRYRTRFTERFFDAR